MNKQRALQRDDWELWITRKDLSIFAISFFHYLEDPLMRRAIKGGFHHQLMLHEEDSYYFIRSTNDFERMNSDILTYINGMSDEDWSDLSQKMQMTSAETKELIQTVDGYSDEEVLEHYEKIMEKVSDIVLYNTSIPYFILTAMETELPEQIRRYDEIKKISEKARATSLYHDVADNTLKRIFNVVADACELDVALVKKMTPDEIKGSLRRGKLTITKDELQRRDSCILLTENETEGDTFIYDESVIKEIKVEISPKSDTDDISGTTAYAGTAQGVVRKIIAVSDMSKMRKGDILIAHTTNPVLMPAIQLAAAIVTDEGGIGCHAAIVSRELKIPCIVGTKNATLVLQDGDMVEVDANEGVVRMIKKYEED